MAVRLQRTSVSKGMTSKTLAIPTEMSRFWHQQSSSKVQSAQVFYQFINRDAKYPSTTLRAQVDGVIYIRMIVLPDGSLAKAEIVGRELNEEFADLKNGVLMAKAKADLDAEALRPFRSVRFERGRTTDTITVSRKFVMQ